MAVRFRHPLRMVVLVVSVLGGCSGRETGSSGGALDQAGAGAGQQTGSVPGELVGRWNGGSNAAGHWYYDFFPNGTYRAWPAYEDNPRVVVGTVDVRPTLMTFSNAGSPVTVRWYISGGLLFMDGFSYVRA